MIVARTHPPESGSERAARYALAGGLFVGLLVLVFLVQCWWWVAHDARVPDFDTAKHVGWAFDIRDAFARGDLGYWFGSFTAYPPLVHVVGAVGLLVGGISIGSAVIAADLVFIPLLAVALYCCGRRLGGIRVGAAAVVFALGAPLLIAQAHVFVLELPETALVAATLWGLVASERFARPLPACAAGVACGLGMLAKPTFPFFVFGALVVLLVRGGWRQARGLAWFFGAAAVVGAPWYLRHVVQLGETFAYATQPPRPPRFSVSNLTWFGWDQINGQVFVPLLAFALIGAVWAITRWRGGIRRSDYTPELVVGVVASYFGLTYGMSVHAPYYSLPMLPYEALLGTIWIGAMRARGRAIATGALAAVAVVNVVAVGIHPLGRVSLRLPGRTPEGFIQPRRLTLLRSYSWPVGPPAADGRLLELFRALHARGIQQVEVQANADQLDFDVTGVILLARIAGMTRPKHYAPQKLGPKAVFVLRATAPTPWPACRHLSDGSAVLVLRRHPGGPYGLATACTHLTDATGGRG